MKNFLLGLLSIPLSCLMLHGAAFTSDFNGGLPGGTVVSGNAFVGDGVMKLTINANGQSGNFFIPDFAGGNAVTNFKAHFKVALGGGTCCGDRMADGMSLSFASDINSGTSFGEEGAGSGITIGFDTWDNAPGDAAPAIELHVGGSQFAFQSMGPLSDRDAAEPTPLGPLLTNSLGDVVNIFTFGPDPTPPKFVDVDIELFGDNTLSLSFSNVVVWNHLAIPYSPISGGNWSFGARTGGANEDAWIDDLSILANYAAGPVSITSQPSDATVTETQTATFSVGVDGTPPYFIQWYSNGVAIAGATGTSYTTPPATLGMNNALYHASVSNALSASAILTRDAKLTVNAGTLVTKVTTLGQTDKVVVTFSKPVNLNSGSTYTMNNGVIVNSRAYGVNHSIVVLSVTALANETAYALTIAGVTGEDASTLLPDPTVWNFYQGFGAFCTDFTGALPAGTSIYGNGSTSGYIADDGTGTNAVLHLTDAANGLAGAFVIQNRTAGFPLDRFHATFRVELGNGTAPPADGMSLSWGSDVIDGINGGAEEGSGTGLIVAFDNFDNGGGEAPALDLKWHGATIAHTLMNLTRDHLVPVDINLDPDGTIDVTYDGIKVYSNYQITNFAAIANSKFAFAGRTGGLNENHWVDDVCINNYTIGPIFITQQPVTTTALEGEPATFTVAVDGSPSYTFQWYTNGTAVAGATASSYTTGPSTAAMEGQQVTVVARNDFSAVTSAPPAIIHVTLSPRVVALFSRGDSEVHVVYTRAVDLGDTDPNITYALDNGVFEAARSYGTNHNEVIIITDSPMVVNTIYTVTISNVKSEDLSTEILPNPTSRSFRQGFGTLCTDFNAPDSTNGMQFFGSATFPGDGFVHLTEEVGGQASSIVIPDVGSGIAMDRLQMRYRARVASAGTPADGYSFIWANDVPNGTWGEDGHGGTGLTIAFDTFDNGGGEAPSIDVRWNNSLVAQVKTGVAINNNFVDVFMNMDSDGKFDLVYNGQVVYNKLQTPFTPRTGARMGFGARTGGLTERCYIDDLKINCFPLGLPSIVQQPGDVALQENQFRTATFNVLFDAQPPYSMQWYSNNIPIAGATTFQHVTPVLNRTANGAGYSVVVCNTFGCYTSRVAQVTVIADTTAPYMTSTTRGVPQNTVLVTFSEAVNAASAVNLANYSVGGGINVTGAVLLANGRSVLLYLDGSLTNGSCYHLTVNGVSDPIGNIANTNAMVTIKGALIPTGPQNLVTWEAEDYDGIFGYPGRTGASTEWTFSTALPGFFGSGYMDLLPNDVSYNIGNTPDLFTNTPRMDYFIDFVNPGTYYLWARGASTVNDGSRNSFHFGLDGVSPDEFTRRVGNRINNWGGDPNNFNLFGWVNDVNGTGGGSVAQVTVATPGVHAINVWQRESGMNLDRFVLTTDSSFSLATSAPGPAASARETAAARVNISRALNGDITVSWTGTGWTLQSSQFLVPANWTTAGTSSPVTITAGTAGPMKYFRLICH